MSKYVFYAPDPTSNGFLNEEESFHACRVLRIRKGDKIRILDGRGGLYEATIDCIDAKKTSYTNLETITQQPEPNYQIHLYVAPTKQMERMEWMVEKCCEFGVHEITFFNSKNSERKEMKLQRLEKIAIAALKQSKNLYLPRIQGISPLTEITQKLSTSPDHQILFAHICEPPVGTLSHVISGAKHYHVFIGPEGDFTEQETKELKAKLFTPFSLGKAILRTETAGMAATHAIHICRENV